MKSAICILILVLGSSAHAAEGRIWLDGTISGEMVRLFLDTGWWNAKINCELFRSGMKTSNDPSFNVHV
jgi:hypothetical protein